MDEKLEKTFGESIKYCPYCGNSDIHENEICFDCGRYLHKVRCESKYKCTKCSCNVPKDALYCWNCGERFAEDDVSSAEKCSMEEKGHSAAMCLFDLFGEVPLSQRILDAYNETMQKQFRLHKPFTPDEEEGIRMQFEITCFIAFLTIREFAACQLPPRPRSATTTTPNHDELNSFITGFLGTVAAFLVHLNYPEVKEILIDRPGGLIVGYGEPLDLRRRVESYMRLRDVKMCCDYCAELLTAVFSTRERHIGAFATSKNIVALALFERFVEAAHLVIRKTVLNTDSQQ